MRSRSHNITTGLFDSMLGKDPNIILWHISIRCEILLVKNMHIKLGQNNFN